MLPLTLIPLPPIHKSRGGLFSGGMIVSVLANRFLPVMKHDEGHGEYAEHGAAEAAQA